MRHNKKMSGTAVAYSNLRESESWMDDLGMDGRFRPQSVGTFADTISAVSGECVRRAILDFSPRWLPHNPHRQLI
ncbi:hypothetical protein J6590_077148 [Homalodisca vitripennis]|nr:hypothetical protein J6590_077148 [Homalodisca vitripennis]